MNSVRPLLVLLVLLGGCRQNREAARVDFERMRMQQRSSAYGASDVFADGMVMRTPPAGTVPYHARTKAGEGSVQLPASAEDLRRGAQEFRIYCEVCHGVNGATATTMAANLRVRPPSLLGPNARAYESTELLAIVTYGKGRMPPYAWALPMAERRQVVAYVMKLQGRTP
jgi:mono/diheme cytochrome c family protein